jgi:hypothetical protein
MNRRKIMNFVDALAVGLGSLVIAFALTGMDMAQASTLSSVVHSSSGQPALLMLGATLATFPGSRRVVWPSLFARNDLSECQEVADAVRRVGLQQRVQAANLYMTDLSDEAIDRAFGDDNSLLDWFSPAYADTKLRSQMAPEIIARIESSARRSGRSLGTA